MQALRWFLNLMSVLAAGVLIGSSIHNLVGDPLSYSDAEAGRGPAAIIIALQSECPFCLEATEFYRSLMARNSLSHRFEIVVAFPSSDSASAAMYVRSHGLSPDRIVLSDLAESGIEGTPTILVIGEDGRLAKRLLGKLNESQQSELLSLVNSDSVSSLTQSDYKARYVDHIPAPTGELVDLIVDVRERHEYAQSHWPNSVNIPLKELQVRYNDEIKHYRRLGIAHRTPALSCRSGSAVSEGLIPAISLPDAGSVAKKFLIELGHPHDAIYLIDSIPAERS